MPLRAPLGFQTPIPPYGQELWEEQYGPPSPNTSLYDQAMAKGSQMHANVGNLDPVQLALATAAPYAMGRFPRAAAAAWGGAIPMLPEWAFGQQAQKTGAATARAIQIPEDVAHGGRSRQGSVTGSARKSAELSRPRKPIRSAILDEQARAAAEARRVAKAAGRPKRGRTPCCRRGGTRQAREWRCCGEESFGNATEYSAVVTGNVRASAWHVRRPRSRQDDAGWCSVSRQRRHARQDTLRQGSRGRASQPVGR